MSGDLSAARSALRTAATRALDRGEVREDVDSGGGVEVGEEDPRPGLGELARGGARPPWPRRREARGDARRARAIRAPGRPEPCAALGGLSLSPLLSASRSSASLQSLSDAVMDASSASSAWPSAPRDAPRARSRARVHDASLTSGSSIATAGPRAARWLRGGPIGRPRTTIAPIEVSCAPEVEGTSRANPRRPVAGRGQTGKYLTETDFRLTAPQ